MLQNEAYLMIVIYNRKTLMVQATRCKVLIEVDINIFLIVSNPQGILDQQLRPHPIHSLNIIFSCLIRSNYILL